jgi:thymidylate synthase
MEAKLAPINLIQTNDFRNGWAEAIRFVLEKGPVITFGGPDKDDRTKIERKTAKDSQQTLVFTGQAIKQIENFEVHPQYFMQGDSLKAYCQQLTREGVAAWSALPEGDNHKSTYNYLELFVNYPRIFGPGTIDQMQILKENLAEQIENDIISNRTQAITWQPEKHAKHHEPPCLQRVQIRYLGKDAQGNHVVEIRYDWRSRDGARAFLSNEVCVTAALNREVIKPNKCIIIRIVDSSTSWHIYKEFWEEAEAIKPVAINPQMMRY